MTLEPVFQIGVWNAWILMLGFFSCFIVVSMKFKMTDRVSDNSEDKIVINTVKFIAPLTFLMVIYSIFLPMGRGTGWFLVGSAVFFLGLIIFTLSRIAVYKTLENEPFTGGVYRFSRHPIYISHFLVFFGIGIASASWLFLLLSVILLLLRRKIMIREEDLTLEKYGDSYDEYLQKTPRWIGMPKTVKKLDIVDIYIREIYVKEVKKILDMDAILTR
jgi:protein-S-isoprenylcysteine O-methyltransferase Ste14